MYLVKVHALSLAIPVMAMNHCGSMEGFVTLPQIIEVQYQDLSRKISSDGRALHWTSRGQGFSEAWTEPKVEEHGV